MFLSRVERILFSAQCMKLRFSCSGCNGCFAYQPCPSDVLFKFYLLELSDIGLSPLVTYLLKKQVLPYRNCFCFTPQVLYIDFFFLFCIFLFKRDCKPNHVVRFTSLRKCKRDVVECLMKAQCNRQTFTARVKSKLECLSYPNFFKFKKMKPNDRKYAFFIYFFNG